jgi:DNA-binding NtrC family response regulator
MSSLWIVHRDTRRRAALARLAAAPEDAVLGAPGEPRFDAAPPARVILLGLEGDWERELEYAHAVQRRVRDARWILLGEARSAAEALRCFDTLRAEFLAYPPRPEMLREQIRRAEQLRAPTLSERAGRQNVADRFSRWFADLEIPELLRALDPRLAESSLLIRGEPGTGRSLLAHYVHLFGGTAAGGFAHVACAETTSAEEILAVVESARRAAAEPIALAICLENVERLSPALQTRVRDWIELGLPPGRPRPPLVRWMATCGDTPLDHAPCEALRRALCELCVRLPPLRERPHLIESLTRETAHAWCEARRERTRRFGEDALAVMEEYPWPGNLRELEALVVQTLAASSSDPVRSDDLQCDGEAFSPLLASDVGALLDEDERSLRASSSAAAEALARHEAAIAAPPGPDLTPAHSDSEAASSEGAQTRIEAAPAVVDGSLSRLVSSLSHEVRNPLATIRTFASLLPERFDDPEFRSRFTRVVNEDVGRIDALVEQLGRLSDLRTPKRESVDIAALLEQLLDAREETIRRRRLLVLKELDSERSIVLADGEQLRFAFEALLGKSLELVPERGDVYLASRRHAGDSPDEASVRVLLRFHDPERSGTGMALPGTSVAENSLELTIAELVIRAQGGTLALDTTREGAETLIVVDLPAR